jgi:hypothetical protein
VPNGGVGRLIDLQSRRTIRRESLNRLVVDPPPADSTYNRKTNERYDQRQTTLGETAHSFFRQLITVHGAS